MIRRSLTLHPALSLSLPPHSLNQNPTLKPMQPNKRILAQVLPNQKHTTNSGNNVKDAILLAEVSKDVMMIPEPIKIEVKYPADKIR